MAWCVKSIDETESKRKPSKPSRSTQKCRLELSGQASLAFVSGCVCQDRKVAHNVQEEADNLDVLVVEDAAASERPASQLTSPGAFSRRGTYVPQTGCDPLGPSRKYMPSVPLNLERARSASAADARGLTRALAPVQALGVVRTRVAVDDVKDDADTEIMGGVDERRERFLGACRQMKQQVQGVS
jgi:hypothetical protein